MSDRLTPGCIVTLIIIWTAAVILYMGLRQGRELSDGVSGGAVTAPVTARSDSPRAAPLPRRYDLQDLFAAMRKVESADGTQLVGDRGLAFGPFQIRRPYFEDACRYGGVTWPWPEAAMNEQRARTLCVWYWARWCPAALANEDLQTLARVHNGGPNGAEKTSAEPYWRKIKAAMEPT